MGLNIEFLAAQLSLMVGREAGQYVVGVAMPKKSCQWHRIGRP